MRINKLIAEHLKISRRKADELICNNMVTVNGKYAILGEDINKEDYSQIYVNNKPLPVKTTKIYLKINKPINYVCSKNGQGSKTIYELLPKQYNTLNPIGRLDKNSSGLLILTNDGNYLNQLAHPSNNKVKKYILELNKPLSITDINYIKSGQIILKDGVSKFDIDNINNQYIATIFEGRNRQIRRTLNNLGYKVITLHRIQYGPYKLDQLKSGQWQKVIKL